MLRFKLLSSTATVPTRATKYSAGYDLYSNESVLVRARERAVIKTGISVAFSSECYGRIAPRSGLAAKYGIDVGAGVIDSDYRGEIMVLLFNHSVLPVEIKQGDKIAQLILEKIRLDEIQVVTELDSTERGEKGFGSSGV